MTCAASRTILHAGRIGAAREGTADARPSWISGRGLSAAHAARRTASHGVRSQVDPGWQRRGKNRGPVVSQRHVSRGQRRRPAARRRLREIPERLHRHRHRGSRRRPAEPLYGIRLPGPQGTYPTRRFSPVRVELMSRAAGYGDIVVQGGDHTSGSGLSARAARRTFSSRGRSEKRAGHWPRSSAPCWRCRWRRSANRTDPGHSKITVAHRAYCVYSRGNRRAGIVKRPLRALEMYMRVASLRTSAICFDVPVLYR
jgi:hypothetical protein